MIISYPLLTEKREDIFRLAQQYGAKRLRVFGSVARGTATEQSDIDFLAAFEPDRSLLDMRYMNDDGTEFNPNLASTPSTCLTCRKYGDPAYEIPCSLARADQDEAIFICFAYMPNSSNIDGKAVLKEMQDCLDRKYGKKPSS
jgi:hypothetical protein